MRRNGQLKEKAKMCFVLYNIYNIKYTCLFVSVRLSCYVMLSIGVWRPTRLLGKVRVLLFPSGNLICCQGKLNCHELICLFFSLPKTTIQVSSYFEEPCLKIVCFFSVFSMPTSLLLFVKVLLLRNFWDKRSS